MPKNRERPMAAHVQAAIAAGQGVGQAKSKVPGARELAPHVRAAVAAGQGVAQTKRDEQGGSDLAVHVRSAIAVGQGNMGGPPPRAVLQRSARYRGPKEPEQEKAPRVADPVEDLLLGEVKDEREFYGGAMHVQEDEGTLYDLIVKAASGKEYDRPSSHFPEWGGFEKSAQKGYDLAGRGTILFGKASRPRVSKRAWLASWAGQASTKEYYGTFTWFQTEGAGLKTFSDKVVHTGHATAHFATATAQMPLQFGMEGTSWKSEKVGREDYSLKED